MTEKNYYFCEGKNSAGKCTICYFSALDFQICMIKILSMSPIPYFHTYPDNMYF